MFDDLLTEYNALEAELEKRRAELSVSLRPKFQAAFTAFFERFPKLEEINFTAYTPYFNDGDECIYSVNEPYMTACGISEIDEYTAGSVANAAEFLATGKIPAKVQSAYDSWANRNYKSAEAYLRAGSADYLDLPADDLAELTKIVAIYPEVQKIIGGVPDDVMKGMFGDHVKIVINRDGAEAEEYDHD